MNWNWGKIKRYLPVIGLALFIYLIIRLDITKILQEVKNLNLAYLPLIFAVALVYLVFQTLKWFIIARKQKIGLNFKDALKINIISDFYGFVTPGRLGSVIRAEYLRKHGDTGKGLSNFAIDKVLDLGSLFILAIGFGFFFYGKIISAEYFYLISLFFAALVFFSFLFYKKKSSRLILKLFYRFVPEKRKEGAKNAFNSFYEDMPSLRFLLFAFMINLATWIINYTIVYSIGLALGVNIPFIYFLAILPVSTLVAQLPITISGLGTRELTMISLFGLFGVEAAKVFSMSILSLLIVGIIPSIMALFLSLKERRKKKDDIHDIQRSGQED
jgi:hypothetical protein